MRNTGQKAGIDKQSAGMRRLSPLFRSKDARENGIESRTLRQMVLAGEISRIDRGTYLKKDTPLSEHLGIALAAIRFPRAIICLLSALSFHEIGTQLPHEIWLAIDRKARKPQPRETPFRVVRFSRRMLSYGIEKHRVFDIEIPITSPARTVVDCFRYRNKIGNDVALEAIKESVRAKKTTIDEILRAAKVCRTRKAIEPYIEALSA
jgi:predicted transcriptional regulator of viral defense system